MAAVYSVVIVLLWLLCYWTEGNKTLTGSLWFDSATTLNLECSGEVLENIDFSSYFNQLVGKNVTFLTLNECTPSRMRIATVMERLNIDLSKIIGMLIFYPSFIPSSDTNPLNAIQFEHLSIQRLEFICSTQQLQIKSTDFLNSLMNLTHLETMGVDMPTLPVTTRLENVRMTNGRFMGPWGGCRNLRKIQFNNWNFDHVPKNWLKSCSQLTVLSIYDVRNITAVLYNSFRGMDNLQVLRIGCCGAKEVPTMLTMIAKNLQHLFLEFRDVRKYSLSNLKIRSLARLTLMKNYMTLEGLPLLGVPQFVLNLMQRTVTMWRFQKSDYEDLHNNVSVVVDRGNLTLDCDCEHGWLARAIKDQRVRLLRSSAQCKDGKELVPSEELECDRFDCDGCTCRRQWSDNTTVARCAGAATRVPRVWGLRALHAAGNRVETISADDLPDSLLFIDLSRNKMSNVDLNATMALFSVRERRMRLAGNPLSCNCGNQVLIGSLQMHKAQVEDYNKLWCIFGEKRMAVFEVVTSELCSAEVQLQRDVQLSMSLGVLAALLGLAAGAGVLYWRYRQNIKVYLYARGYCMWWLREEEVDSDRFYDAFLSFSHGDEQFVLGEIIPRLDSEYKLCLHYRDWVVGDFIPAQISRSVQQSRRTIIVLSKNFVESVWGLLEFRTAHESALREGRARVIVIVLDDVVNDERLAPELRNYVRTNTYVRWGDKWFWEKLRYAMPHHLSSTHTPVTAQPTAANISMEANISYPVSA